MAWVIGVLAAIADFSLVARLLMGGLSFGVIGALIFAYGPQYAKTYQEKKETAMNSAQQSGTGNVQNNYFGSTQISPPAITAPNISFQKYALFWVETEPKIYYLGIVAKLFNLDNKAYLIKGIVLDKALWKLVPRGSYVIGRYTEFQDHAEIMEDNYIKPSSEGYFKKLLPIRIEMTVQGGAAPDFTLRNKWKIILDTGTIPTVPNYYTAYEQFLSNSEWEALLKSRSPIKIDDLTYKKLEDS